MYGWAGNVLKCLKSNFLMKSSNKRIAKNTIMLYIRMMFTMLVSLYTSRVILNVLGINDYGIYSLTGSIVAMFGFLNGAMSSSTQRYLTFELGKENQLQLNRVYSTSILIHGIISIIVLLLAETVGLWFLYNKSTIPPERMDAAVWIFHFSIISSVLSIMNTPKIAAIVAHERMKAFAAISIIEVSLKLAIIFLLMFLPYDKLILYGILILIVQTIVFVIYSTYCRKRFEECRYCWYWNSSLFKEMFHFAGWNLFGSFAVVTYMQGLNMMLNVFFNTAINAARGIAVQVQNTVAQFSMNFQIAINPQITKSYAQNDLSNMYSLIFRSSRYSFFLLFIISLPILLEANQILVWWLKIVPEHTVNFLRIILVISMLDASAGSLMIAAQATGKIRIYQLVVGGILLLILPVSYMFLKLGYPPEIVFVVHLLITCIAWIVRLFIVHRLINLPIRNYFKNVILKIMFVAAASIIVPVLIWYFMLEDFVRFIIVTITSVCISTISIYLVGLEKTERKFILNNIRNILQRIKK